ncbi:MAG: hypothetical protein V1889_01800 [archaeon]
MIGMLELFASRGFFLDRDVFGILSKKSDDEVTEIINGLVKSGVKERVITKKIFDEYILKLERKRDGLNIKLLSTPKFLSRKIGVGDFVRYFRSRYEVLSGMLATGVENMSSIRRIGGGGGVYNIVAMVVKKNITKNKNLLIEVEDLTGRVVVLVNQDRRDLFDKAKNLMLDDVVLFRVSGSGEMLFVNDIIFPDVGLEKEKYGDVDEYIAFSGDFHVGSRNFLEKDVLRFVDWLNGEVGDERQRAIARKVKYLVLVGDMVDGVGVYSGQEGWLNIKDIKGQYKKLGEIFGKIRKDLEIAMCAGQHDAVWVGEPQKVIPEKWAGELYKMKNLKLVTSPALVDVGGFRILMYHGASINRFVDETENIRVNFGHRSPTRVVREMLRCGHLAPMYGLMDYVLCEVDPMVIDIVPDIVATGDQHRAEVDCYNNILMVASSCWQSTTPFEERVGNVPEPCRVPLFNLKTREIKIVDFSEDKIKWEEGDDLVCKLGGENV